MYVPGICVGLVEPPSVRPATMSYTFIAAVISWVYYIASAAKFQ